MVVKITILVRVKISQQEESYLEREGGFKYNGPRGDRVLSHAFHRNKRHSLPVTVLRFRQKFQILDP